jgi:hypothetical protein
VGHARHPATAGRAVSWPPWSVARRFAGYQPADSLAVSAQDSAAWLTGQSSYRHSQLSPGQELMLDAVANLGYATVKGGFPFNAGALRLPYRPEPLPAASVRNAAQYLAARTDRRHRAELARHLQPLLDHCERRLLLLCGSCGLEMLTAAIPALRLPPALQVLAIGIGPVGRTPPAGPALRLHVIRARGDWISRLGCRLTPDLQVTGSHMSYPDQPAVRDEVLRVAAEFLR